MNQVRIEFDLYDKIREAQ